MSSALGDLAIVEQASAVGPAYDIRATLVGDADYATGGTTGLLAALRVATGQATLNIIAVEDQSPPANLTKLEYDHANDKLFSRVLTTGAESALHDDQSLVTYGLHIVAG